MELLNIEVFINANNRITLAQDSGDLVEVVEISADMVGPLCKALENYKETLQQIKTTQQIETKETIEG